MIENLYKRILNIGQKIFYLDQWYLIFDLKPDMSKTFHNFKEMMPPGDRFWADPHIIQVGASFYVFIEEYMYKIRKGHISVIEMDNQGNYIETVKILERNYHLSYPFVFEWEDKYYMVPESSENRTVELYECLEFPHKWEFRMNLMENVMAVDTTLFRYDGKWWLFSGTSKNRELNLFYSDELFTKKWKSHPLNPIISDIKIARPAGRLFLKNERIFRPSQDCSLRYGYGININEIVRFSETEYLERKVAFIIPDWSKNVKAAHTFINGEQITMIDCCRMRRRFLS